MTNKQIPDVVELTRQLVRMETISKNFQEKPALEAIAAILEPFGFQCHYSYYDPEHPSRASLVAQTNPCDDKPALCFGGHIDTVPFGNAPWTDDPLEAVIKDGRLYGRGSADMKGGMAASICAALGMLDKLDGRNIIIHVYGGEELGLIGSEYLARKDPEAMGNIGAVIIAEPSGNKPQFGNKGVTWYEVAATGVTAHASMPEKGDNALAKLLPTVCRLKDYYPEAEHPFLGKSTMALTVMQSGMNANSIPDKAFMRMDFRTVVGQSLEGLLEEVKSLTDPGVTVEIVAQTLPLWTEPDLPFCRTVRSVVTEVTGTEPEIQSAIFGTDASSLRYFFKEEPLVILGPGAQDMAHKTDEFVTLAELRQAQTIYQKIISAWYGV